MKTNFTPDQLSNPRIQEADDILRKCVHCGLCTATCSTYVLLGDERDSPRGRIYLIKDMLEGNRDASNEVRHHVDRCLSCLSCMTTCPGGVDYMHLADLARAHIEETAPRSLKDRFMRGLLTRTLPYPARFRLALLGGRLARPLRGLFKALGLKEMAAMLELAPAGGLSRGKHNAAGSYEAASQQRRRVIMLAGCAQQVLRPEINDATVRLLNRIGVEVVVAKGAGCCGALVHHMGREAEAHKQALANIKAWEDVARDGPVDAVIINASGCGTVVKDYGHMFRLDPELAPRAAQISDHTKDITEFLHEYADLLPSPKRWTSLNVAYHSACSMQHGQGVTQPPRELLRQAGFNVLEFAEGHICCGSAGVYNVLQPDIARELRDRKVANIEKVAPDLIATGNLGCITQIQGGTEIPAVHTIELLDWAYGGPVPRNLRHLEQATVEVPDLAPQESVKAAE